MYGKIDRIIKRDKRHPLFEVYSALSIFKAFNDAEISKKYVYNNVVDELIKQCSS